MAHSATAVAKHAKHQAGFLRGVEVIEAQYASANNLNDDDGRAGLSRIEIDEHGLVQGEQAGLIGAKTDCGECAVFEEGHECDLNGPSCPIQDTADLHRADRALDGGPSLDRVANEYIAATNNGRTEPARMRERRRVTNHLAIEESVRLRSISG